MNQTDKDIYESSLKSLVDNLNKSVISSSNDIVIALSRKGPRLLEYLRKEKGLHDITVMTEHALPFLFEQIVKEPSRKVRIHIVDDAIYFGSTILALKEEIEQYIKIFGLDNEDRVKIAGIYACIKDPSSLSFDDTRLFALTDLRSGYGHYFVKQVMKNLRSLGSSLEVEFPSIDYEFDIPINIDILFQKLKSFWGNRIYMIDEPLGIKSISILLSDVNEASFRKLRIFIHGNKLSVVSIAPELTMANLKLFKYIGFGNLLDVNMVWRALAKRLIEIANSFDNNQIDRRNIMRTGVILVNYFSSIDTYCYFKRQIEDVFLQLFGNIKKRSLDKTNLFYLLGNQEDVKTVSQVWNEALANLQYDTRPFNEKDEEKVSDVVFESSLLYGRVVDSLESSNFSLLQNSRTIDEALSAMFFNQTLLIERWSRMSEISRQERLRFGYAYQYIWDFIWNNAKKLKTEDLSPMMMHRWVDVQIDNGSLVPQYILDKKLFQWIRVFRPGENEDLLISHLGRLVVHVILQMNRKKDDRRIGKVIKKNLEGVLSAIYNKFRYSIEIEEIGCNLNIDLKKHILYYDDTQDSLVDYLERMGILVIEGGRFVSLSSRIAEQEFSKFTTLSEQLVKSIDKYIGEILDEMGNKPQAMFTYSNTINYFLANTISIDSLRESIAKIKDKMEEALRNKIKSLGQDMAEEMFDKQIFDFYHAELSCYSMNDRILSDLNSNITNTLRSELWRVRKIVNVINLFTLLNFGSEKDVVESYLESISPEVKKETQIEEIISLFQTHDIIKKVGQDKLFLLRLIRYINNI